MNYHFLSGSGWLRVGVYPASRPECGDRIVRYADGRDHVVEGVVARYRPQLGHCLLCRPLTGGNHADIPLSEYDPDSEAYCYALAQWSGASIYRRAKEQP